ncbi:MAG: type II toxin-antitoxin system Phd/YefM family antitoxin [Thermoanaerobaculia bacterium]
MAIHTTYAKARANLKELLDRVGDDREAVIIHRRNGRDVAVIAASELGGLLETIYLFSSPNNARRLWDALERSHRGKVKRPTIRKMRAEFGLD